ncbi:thioesterase family protein [Leucobacter weissii]|uniref:Thioesterase family protein n=2 Tax=Leucobacter weissii TaxID=1983706 RepID=A0A939MI83_9MICO|nr:thioesterase family protein [Leucobacter weissii]
MIHTSVRDVRATFRLQSVHAHFHAPATVDDPVRYEPTTLQRSRRFSSFGMAAMQNERLVASGTVSFHADEDSHQHAAVGPAGWSRPEASAPAHGAICPEPNAPIRRPFDVRRAVSSIPQQQGGRPLLGLWVRTVHPLIGWHEIHKAALAWVSDFSLTRVVDLGHEHESGIWFAATLNHAMWFHRPVDVNEWIFYELHSPSYRAGIAHSSGRFFTQSNELVASVSQDCVVRKPTNRGSPEHGGRV